MPSSNQIFRFKDLFEIRHLLVGEGCERPHRHDHLVISSIIQGEILLQINTIDWTQGSALPLPYPDNHFSMVITRYSFHHFINPSALLDEMIRVCQPNGTLLIADVALPTPHTELYDHMEKLRDPSHVHALSQQEWEDLLQSSGLNHLQKSEYKVHLELEAQLKASFPNENDIDKIRQIFLNDVATQQLGVNTRMENHQIYFSYPISIFVGTK